MWNTESYANYNCTRDVPFQIYYTIELHDLLLTFQSLTLNKGRFTFAYTFLSLNHIDLDRVCVRECHSFKWDLSWMHKVGAALEEVINAQVARLKSLIWWGGMYKTARLWEDWSECRYFQCEVLLLMYLPDAAHWCHWWNNPKTYLL